MKLFIFSIFFLSHAFAETQQTFKIVYLLRQKQMLAEVQKSGGVTKEAQILWDERFDGQLEKDMETCLGALSRFRASLICDAEKMKEISDERTKKEAEEEAEKQSFKLIKDRINSETATAAEVRKALKMILKKLGE